MKIEESKCFSARTANRTTRNAAGYVLRGSVRLLLLAGVVAAELAAPGWSAGVELRPGTIVEYASLAEGRQILGASDAFTQAMSQFDRCVRMKTSRLVTQTELLTYISNEVRTWGASEQTMISNVLVPIQRKLTPFELRLPPRILLVKTSGAEEGGAAYTRANCIVLPQNYLTQEPKQLEEILIHELFHVFSTHNVQLRPALYGQIGFFECGEVVLPDSLLPVKITNPDAFHYRFAIRLRAEDRQVTAMPFIYSKSATYNQGGGLFDYLQLVLLELEFRDGRYVPVCRADGQPQAIEGAAYVDYWSLIGANTSYIIHPEETLADNFVLVVNGATSVAAPRVVHLLRAVLDNPASHNERLLAGWFRGSLMVGGDRQYQIEVSRNLTEWFAYDKAQSRNGRLDFVDYEAWIYDGKFYRARLAEAPHLTPGSTNHMVWIGPGSFAMGSPPGANGVGNEAPVTTVSISRGFWLGAYEVTQAEYSAVLGSNPSSHTGDDLRPVERVRWMDATNYCGKLTEQERAAGRLPSGYVNRLPTEAEWEYACRGGSAMPYYFGDDPGQVQIHAHAWFRDNSGYETHAVGTKLPNAWGLHDMYGNVAEWCADWYGSYRGGTVTDPKGPASGPGRSVRGGSFDSGAGTTRSASREQITPGYTWELVGFRVALAPPLP